MFYIRLILLNILIINAGLLFAGEVHEFTLNNGLQLIVKEDHRAPVVVSQVWYKVGSSYEMAGKTGLSHMLEHMMFKGTKNYPLGEFSRIMSINGASENAFTSYDYTVYYQMLEKSRLPLSFEMEADRMRNLILTKEEFLKERKVVTEERRVRTEDKPTRRTYEHFLATAYQTSPYQNPIIGWMNDIESYNLADLEQWYQYWYAPNNAIVIVVGDVKAQSVLELAQQHFGILPSLEVAKVANRPEIEQLGSKRLNIQLPAKVPYLVMGYKVPALNTVDKIDYWEIAALDVISYLLDGGKSARFSKNLVRGQEIAVNASAGYDPFSRLTDLFTFRATPTQSHTVIELETALREQVQQLQTTLVEKSELERIKNKIRASQIYEMDSLFYQAIKIGMLEAIGLNWQLFDQYVASIKLVTAEQVQTVANKYLIDKNLTIATLEPQALNQTQSTSGVTE
ncbi:MAG: insulinase family protein [Thiomargarita sp.]|nr:insulinase family protein [Thiomargarita sp.]